MACLYQSTHPQDSKTYVEEGGKRLEEPKVISDSKDTVQTQQN